MHFFNMLHTQIMTEFMNHNECKISQIDPSDFQTHNQLDAYIFLHTSDTQSNTKIFIYKKIRNIKM